MALLPVPDRLPHLVYNQHQQVQTSQSVHAGARQEVASCAIQVSLSDWVIARGDSFNPCGLEESRTLHAGGTDGR